MWLRLFPTKLVQVFTIYRVGFECNIQKPWERTRKEDLESFSARSGYGHLTRQSPVFVLPTSKCLDWFWFESSVKPQINDFENGSWIYIYIYIYIYYSPRITTKGVSNLAGHAHLIDLQLWRTLSCNRNPLLIACIKTNQANRRMRE